MVIDFWTILPAALVLACIFYAASRYLAIRYTSEQNEGLETRVFNRAQTVNDTWRTVAQVVGGAAFVITFIWTMFQDRDNDLRSRQQQANQLYIDSSKLLSKSDPVERAAGVFALNLVSDDRPAYRFPVRDLLVNFILAHGDSGRESDVGFVRDKRVDLSIQAALSVLGRRKPDRDDFGRSLDLKGAYLVGGKFNGTTGFAKADFYDAVLYGSDLSGSHLEGAHFDGAHLSDWEAYGGAGSGKPNSWTNDTPFVPDRWDRWERYRFVANFRGADLIGASFTGAGLTGVLFDSADTDIRGADFTRANITRAHFRSAKNVLLANFKDACYLGAVRDRPQFDASLHVAFEGDKSIQKPSIFIKRCP